jgi:hypothetical protein
MKVFGAEPDPQTALSFGEVESRALPQGMKLSDRITGAFLCSVEAAIGMAEVALIVALWLLQFSLILSLAMIRAVLTGGR